MYKQHFLSGSTKNYSQLKDMVNPFIFEVE